MGPAPPIFRRQCQRKKEKFTTGVGRRGVQPLNVERANFARSAFMVVAVGCAAMTAGAGLVVKPF